VGANTSTISSSANGPTGAAGTVTVDVASANLTDSSIKTTVSGSGNAAKTGDIYLEMAGTLALKGGTIDASTSGTAKGGLVQINASGLTVDGGSIRADSTAGAGATATAGDVTIDLGAGGGHGALTVVNGGVISSQADGTASATNGVLGCSGCSAGSAGKVSIANAGNILLGAGPLQQSGKPGGTISTSVNGTGSKAGAVDILNATDITLDNGSTISSTAGLASGGNVGTIYLNVSDSLSLNNKSGLTIENDALNAPPPPSKEPPPTPPNDQPYAELEIKAGNNITMTNSSFISAAATGPQAAASNIYVQFGNVMTVDPSTITTSSKTGNGGRITIVGGKLLKILSSSIITSVTGASSSAQGSGGDIYITVPALYLGSGFIEANTSANGGNGGRIYLNVPLIWGTWGDNILLGGSTPYDPTANPGYYNAYGFNVIQSAAPNGVNGAITLTPPVDLAGALTGLRAQRLTNVRLATNRCTASAGSSLVTTGRGGLPGNSTGALRVGLNDAPTPLATWSSPGIDLALLEGCPQ